MSPQRVGISKLTRTMKWFLAIQICRPFSSEPHPSKPHSSHSLLCSRSHPRSRQRFGIGTRQWEVRTWTLHSESDALCKNRICAFWGASCHASVPIWFLQATHLFWVSAWIQPALNNCHYKWGVQVWVDPLFYYVLVNVKVLLKWTINQQNAL